MSLESSKKGQLGIKELSPKSSPHLKEGCRCISAASKIAKIKEIAIKKTLKKAAFDYKRLENIIDQPKSRVLIPNSRTV